MKLTWAVIAANIVVIAVIAAIAAIRALALSVGQVVIQTMKMISSLDPNRTTQ